MPARILAKLDSQGKVIWSSFLGRDNGVQGWIAGIFVDSSGNIYAAVNGFALVKVEPVGPPPLLATASVVNSAEFTTGIAAGGLVSVFGTGLTTVQGTVTASVPLPTTLEGTSVSILGEPAPILAVANNGLGQEQVNVQAPLIVHGEGPGGRVGLNMIVVRRGRALGYADIGMLRQWPAIFSHPGQPAITHADSSFVTRDNPARPGETIVVWYTGGGAVTPIVAPGQPAPASPLSTTITTPRVDIYGERAAVVFSGLTPGFVGLYQINVIVPPAPAGEATLSLAIPDAFPGGVPLITSTVMIYVR